MADRTSLPHPGLTCGIYARKSTEQHDVSEDAKSVTRQIEHASGFATANGWHVGEVFQDDAISGAEFLKRPGLMRLLDAIGQTPRPFDVLVIMEKARLGREVGDTAATIKRIVRAGVKIVSYLDKKELRFETAQERMVEHVLGIVDEMERERASQRTFDAMLRKARAGHVTGGKVFGYDNVRAADNGHVERRINPEEAAVVKRIYEMYASGFGAKRIAHRLNEERAPSPVSRRAARGWCAGSVKEVLRRPLYRGEIIWGKQIKRDGFGMRKPHPRDERDWIRLPAPGLRIIDPDLAARVDRRAAAMRAAYLRNNDGTLWGRPINATVSKYLLMGFARCAVCGGAFTVRSRSHGTGRLLLYRCITNTQKGRAICPNDLQMRLRDADAAVLAAVEHQVLRREVVEAVLDGAVKAMAGDTGGSTRRAHLEAQLKRAGKELDNLIAIAASGAGEAKTIVAAIKEREAEQARLTRALAELDAVEKLPRLDRARLGATIKQRLADYSGLLRRQVAEARGVLGWLLAGKLAFRPDPAARRYTFSGEGRLDAILRGIVPSMGVVSPTGFEPVFPD